MRTEKFLPQDVVGKLKKMRILVLEKYETQANFALVTGQHEDLVSRLLLGRRYLKPEEKELWASTLKCDYSLFPDPPTFKKCGIEVPNYLGE
jgi:hypothetical protein